MIEIFQWVKNDPTASAYFTDAGSTIVKFFPFGQAPQDVKDPYAVWKVVTGDSFNTLSCPPQMDFYTIQVDVYGDRASQVNQGARILRDVFERYGYVNAYRGETRDLETKRYRESTDYDFHVSR